MPERQVTMSKKNQQKEKSFLMASLENFWYYYKWPFIGGIVLFFAVLAFLTATADVSEPTDADVAAVFARPLTTQEFEFQSRLGDVISDTDGDGETRVGTTSYYISEQGTSDNDVIAKSKFEAAIAYGEGDLVLMDGANMKRYSPKDLWAPLADFVDISQFAEEDLYYRDGVAVAVRLSDSAVLLDMQFIIDDVYAGIMYVPEVSQELYEARRENAAKMLLELVKK